MRLDQQGYLVLAASRIVPPPSVVGYRGAFLIPRALPGIPHGNGLGHVWDPALACYSGYRTGDWRWFDQILDVHVARGHNIVEYSLAGMPYGTDYPEVMDDPDRVVADLQRIYARGLDALVCATDDRKGGELPVSFRICAPLIRKYFPMYEMNGVLGNDEEAQKRLIAACLAQNPHGDCELHFTPGHGSISYNEVGGWRWCQGMGVKGLLAQGSNYISQLDPVVEGKGFETTCVRLAGLVGYEVPEWDGSTVPEEWAGIRQRCTKFEWGVYEAYQGGITERAMIAFTGKFMPYAKHAAGFFDGGPALAA
jgi:hypothetical protein